ncbi:MAG: isoprenylcysteine carboxylmethyltransferase family protein [Methanomicrobia archaeon]|nr:isoprenylcysteine carboxylmethyltransferase family protein [Methanomicrobia archaeon]
MGFNTDLIWFIRDGSTMKNRFVEWSKKEYTARQRFILLIPLGILFVVIIPLILLVLPSYIDRWLNIPRLIFEPINLTVAIFLILSGLIFAIWSIQVQFKMGKGTPAPLMPTQKLVVTAPYIYCRNPMAFGTIILYFGIVVFTGSLSSFVLLALMTLALLMYIKFVEEKELEARFGQEYAEYKKRTPFLIPRSGKKEE